MSSKKTKQTRKLAQGESVTTHKVNAKPKNSATSARYRNYFLPSLIILILSFILYGASISYGYILDDEMVITKNVYVQKGFNGIPDIFSNDTFLGYFQKKENLYLLQGGRYRPLSLASFAAEVSLFGSDKPNVSHTINILLYALTGIMLFSVFVKLFSTGTQKVYLLPLAAAVLWILHPIHTECVANIKGRDEILSLLGSLSALWASLHYVDKQEKTWLFASGILLFIGLMAKENALTFLAIIPLTLWVFRRISFSSIFKLAVPLVIAAVLFNVIRYQALGYFLDHGQGITNLMNDSFLGMNYSEKYATIIYTLGWYLKLLIFPHPLTHDYYPYHVAKMNWSDIGVIISLIIYVSMVAWALYKIKSRNIYAYSILFFLMALSIVSNLLVSVGTFMNERFLYMPSVAFCLALGYFLCNSLPSFFKNNSVYIKTASAIMIVFSGFYIWRTMTRVSDWKDQVSLDGAAIKVSKNSARANCYYAVSLYTQRYLQTTNPTEQAALVDTMEYYLNKAVAIYPDYENAYQMKSGVITARYNLDHDLGKVFMGYKELLRKIPENTAMRDYLEKLLATFFNTDLPRTVEFCYEAGYNIFYKEKKDYKNALHFLQSGFDHAPSDTRFIKAIEEVYTQSGQKLKAEEWRKKYGL